MRLFFCVVLLFGWLPLKALAQTTIVLTANTQGEYQPCPT